MSLINVSKKADKDLINKNIFTEIGRGAAGIVYVNKHIFDKVFKVSMKDNICRQWESEYKIYQKLNKFDIDTKLCKIIKMVNYTKMKDRCIMELTRAFNPRGLNHYYTIHPQFQYEDFIHIYKSRGHFLGVKNLIKEGIFTDKNISLYVKNIAIVLARLHYKVKNDGYDIELFISKKPNENTVIYIADFDLSRFYDVINEETLSRLSWCLESVPYFPNKGPLYSIFSENYINEASKYNMKNTALKVLKEFTKYV